MERGLADGKVLFSPDLQLALDCCAFAFKGGGAPSPMAQASVDWSRFAELVRFHRIEGIAWNALSGADFLPPDLGCALSQAAAGIAAQNLLATVECQTLLERFQRARVPLLFLKGLTTGALAYANPAIKSALDIDLLIDPADLGRAAELLRACGYRLAAPRQSPGDRILRSWHRTWKESVWSKSAPRLQIDLHTRVADSPRLLPGFDVHSPQQLVHVCSGIRLPTLAPDELFAYLAVHGASSAWFRLKWICDFAALLAGESAQRIDALYRRSQALGAGRAAGQALLLADQLFRTLDTNPELREELRRDRITLRLFMTALKLLTREPREPTEIRLGTLPIHSSQFLLLPGARYKASELLRQTNRLLARGRS